MNLSLRIVPLRIDLQTSQVDYTLILGTQEVEVGRGTCVLLPAPDGGDPLKEVTRIVEELLVQQLEAVTLEKKVGWPTPS